MCTETMTMMPQPDVQSVGIQCDLLVAAPLKKLQYKQDNIIEESLPSETEGADRDTSFYISQDDITTEYVQIH